MLVTLAERAADAEPPLRDYTRTLVEGVADHREAIDARISAALAPGWTLPRTPKVDRSALRIAVLEIDHLAVPDAVAVAEAREMGIEVLPPDVRGRVAVEQGAKMGWDRYAGTGGAVIGMHTFGASAPAAELLKKFGFTPEAVLEAARAQAKRGPA